MNFDVCIPITIHKNKLLIIKNGWPIDLSTPEFIQYNLSPNTKSIDKFLKIASDLKNLKEFQLEIKNDWFLFCDACLTFKNIFMEGMIYKIESEKVKLDYDNIWICSYIKFFLGHIPKKIYINVKEKE